LEAAQRLTDRVVESLDHPVVAALILGKMAQGAERGVRLDIQPGSYLHQMQLDPHDAVTVLGNLIDNAIDAAGETPPPHRVRIAVEIDAERFGVVVEDSGPGLSEAQRRLALQRGWSTKPSANGFGRGIGLALVVQIVRRHDGTMEIATSDLGGASFAVTVPTRAHAEAGR
jgi:sensor histidine kinase regulating citrate/malate metabolism